MLLFTKLNGKNRAGQTSGFTLIETALVVLVLGLIVAALVKAIPVVVQSEQQKQEKERYDVVRAGLNSYIKGSDPATPGVMRNRFPCPAPLTANPDSADYGLSQAHPTEGCDASVDGIFPIVVGGNTVAFAGAIPTRSLEISSSHMVDAYKNKITYVVSRNMVQDNALDSGLDGQLVIQGQDGVTFTSRAQFVLVSHGENGAGAFNIDGARMANCASTSDAADGHNCDLNDNIFRESQIKLSEDSAGDFYDDRLAFSLVDEEDDEWWESIDGVEDVRNKNPGVVCVGQNCDPDDFAADAHNRLLVEGTARVNGSLLASGKISAAKGAPSAADNSVEGFSFDADGDTGMFVINDADGGASGGDIAFFLDNYQALTILENGNVGIGVNNPSTRLDFGALKFYEGLGNVSNGADIEMRAQGLIAAESNLFLNIDSNNDQTTAALIIGNNRDTSAASELMRIREDGNVGIGTSNPQATLDVNGNTHVSGNSAVDGILGVGAVDEQPTSGTLRVAGVSNLQGEVNVRGGAINIDSDDDSDWGSIYNSPDVSGLVISSKHDSVNQHDLVIHENGNVGVGHSDPSVKLDVNGFVRPGNQNMECSEEIVGSIRYNQSRNRTEICNGRLWEIFETYIPLSYDVYGGVYTTNNDGTCRYKNPYTGACNCPGGFTASGVSEFNNGTGGSTGYYCDGGTREVCGIKTMQCINTSRPLTNFGGVFTTNNDGTCRYKNPFTNTCSCPSGFSAAGVAEFNNGTGGRTGYYCDGGARSVCGIRTSQCVRTSEPATNFAGLFTTNNDGTCRYKNPFTNDCSCPSGFRTSGVSEFNNGTGGSTGYYCDGGTREVCGVKTNQCTNPRAR